MFVPLLTLVLLYETNVFLEGLASLHGERDAVAGKADSATTEMFWSSG
jgi:hypothetical protein